MAAIKRSKESSNAFRKAVRQRLPIASHQIGSRGRSRRRRWRGRRRCGPFASISVFILCVRGVFGGWCLLFSHGLFQCLIFQFFVCFLGFLVALFSTLAQVFGFLIKRLEFDNAFLDVLASTCLTEY
jgi:hypothetical protein